ncbi:hypothetical protein RJ640_029039 [Escallonia rubra]|uniref:Uncharacterized protein n=1 Tax=Escallonia rubra TaxID=112253 RepID=A0AA88RTM0_9ASTE|nr:hypothetical protein RJ640_029039 [Escallonia rubra]
MGGPSLLRSVRLWITGTNVVEWNSRRVTRSTVPRCEVQVVMITPGYALAPLTGTPEPANACENPGRSVLHSSDRSSGAGKEAFIQNSKSGLLRLEGKRDGSSAFGDYTPPLPAMVGRRILPLKKEKRLYNLKSQNPKSSQSKPDMKGLEAPAISLLDGNKQWGSKKCEHFQNLGFRRRRNYCNSPMSIPILEACKKRKPRPNLYGFKTFGYPGCPIDLSGPLRGNIRIFLQECAELEDYNVEGIPTWCTLLVKEDSGFVVPLYTIEESVEQILE